VDKLEIDNKNNPFLSIFKPSSTNKEDSSEQNNLSKPIS